MTEGKWAAMAAVLGRVAEQDSRGILVFTTDSFMAKTTVEERDLFFDLSGMSGSPHINQGLLKHPDLHWDSSVMSWLWAPPLYRPTIWEHLLDP